MDICKIRSDNTNKLYMFTCNLVDDNVDLKILCNNSCYQPITNNNMLTVENKPKNRQETWSNYSKIIINSLTTSNITSNSNFEYDINEINNQLNIVIKERIVNTTSKVLLVKFECAIVLNPNGIFSNIIYNLYDIILNKDSKIKKLELMNNRNNYQLNELQYIIDNVNQEKENTIKELQTNFLLLLNSKKRKIKALSNQLNSNIAHSDVESVKPVIIEKITKARKIVKAVKPSGTKLTSASSRANSKVLKSKNKEIDSEMLIDSLNNDNNNFSTNDNMTNDDTEDEGDENSNLTSQSVQSNFDMKSINSVSNSQNFSQISNTINATVHNMTINNLSSQQTNLTDSSYVNSASKNVSSNNNPITNTSNASTSIFSRKKPSLLDKLIDFDD